MNIYFAGAIRGGGDPGLYAEIIKILHGFGTVTTRHLASPEVQESKLTEMNDSAIFSSDLEELRRSDVLIAEISTPSHGVGYKIAKCELIGIPIAALYREGSNYIISALISGNPSVTVIKYSDTADLQKKLQELFEGKFSYLYGAG